MSKPIYKLDEYVFVEGFENQGQITDVVENADKTYAYRVHFYLENGQHCGYFSEEKLMGVEQPPVIESKKEMVNHPDHYSGSKYECIEVMRDIYGDEAVKTFCTLNAFKYVWRANKKNGAEDIKKANWYLTYAEKLNKNKSEE